MNPASAPLYERYRPALLADVIGQSKACKMLKRMIAAGVGGRAFWLSGATGTGKTTIANIIAQSIADPFYAQEHVGRKMNLRVIEDIERTANLYALGKGGRAFIVNEAHGLSTACIEVLLDTLEPIPSHVVWVFTTTKDGHESLFENEIDAHPLLSRCHAVSLTNQGLASAFAKRAREIATAEGLNGQPESAYVKLAQRCHNNMREMLQRIEAGEMME